MLLSEKLLKIENYLVQKKISLVLYPQIPKPGDTTAEQGRDVWSFLRSVCFEERLKHTQSMQESVPVLYFSHNQKIDSDLHFNFSWFSW